MVGLLLAWGWLVLLASPDWHFVAGRRAGGGRFVRVVTIKWADCPRLRNYFLDFGLFSWTQ